MISGEKQHKLVGKLELPDPQTRVIICKVEPSTSKYKVAGIFDGWVEECSSVDQQYNLGILHALWNFVNLRLTFDLNNAVPKRKGFS